MALSEAEKQEQLDYFFQHNYYRVEQAAGRLGKKRGKFALNISAQKGEVRTTYTVPDDDATMEFALAIANFAMIDGPHNVDHWLEFLRDLGGDSHSAAFDNLHKELEIIRKGSIEVNLNKEKITAGKAYEIIATKAIFASDVDADAFLSELRKAGLVYPLMFQMYHAYCLDLWYLLQKVHTYRKQYNIRPKPIQRENICIYCKSKEGIFDHFEHTIPESLGNEGSFLPRGYVCGYCKLALDDVEDGVTEMVPFSMLLVTMGSSNKKGKLPALKSRELHMVKKSPNRIIINSLSKKAQIKPEPLEGGGFEFQLTIDGKPDVHKLARILYKGALGGIALERGRDFVLDTRFDKVRHYITHGGTFSNKMAMFKESKPSHLIQATWIEVDNVPLVDLTLRGIRFLFVLGEEPKLPVLNELKPKLLISDLSLEKPAFQDGQLSKEGEHSE